MKWLMLLLWQARCMPRQMVGVFVSVEHKDKLDTDINRMKRRVLTQNYAADATDLANRAVTALFDAKYNNPDHVLIKLYPGYREIKIPTQGANR